MKGCNDLNAKLDEVKSELDYLVNHYEIEIRTTEDKAEVSLKRGNINRMLKLNNDKRTAMVKTLDYLNDDKECLYFACLELGFIK